MDLRAVYGRATHRGREQSRFRLQSWPDFPAGQQVGICRGAMTGASDRFKVTSKGGANPRARHNRPQTLQWP